MPDLKISQLTAYTTPVEADVFPVVDTATTTSKKVTFTNLKNSMLPAIAARAGWAFPDSSINCATDILANRFHTIKPIWYEVNSSGVLVLRNSSSYGSNFYYTTTNAKTVRDNSVECYVTVSLANATWMNTLCSDATKRSNAITTLVAFCADNDFTGVELDWEAYSDWTAGQYTNFKIFINQLGIALHARGFKFGICAPPIWNDSTTVTSNEWTNRNSQGYYEFKYEDFNTINLDQLVIMAYDYHFDMGGGEPTQPLEWLDDIIQWAKLKVTDFDKIVIGLPSAGYSGTTGAWDMVGRTYSYLSAQTGFSGASRDAASGELIWANGATSYAAIDDAGMTIKIKRAEALGVKQVSLWHIGDNKYSVDRMPNLTPISRTSIQNVAVDVLSFVLYNNGSTLTTGIKGDIEVPYSCTINAVTLLADQSGSIVVDIWKDTYANYPPTVADTITASAKPTISAATKSTDSTLTGWSKTIEAGSILRLNIDSVSTVTRVLVSIKVTKN